MDLTCRSVHSTPKSSHPEHRSRLRLLYLATPALRYAYLPGAIPVITAHPRSCWSDFMHS